MMFYKNIFGLRCSWLICSNNMFDVLDFVFKASFLDAKLISAGAHHPERATYLFSCNGVFTSKVIFRYAFPAKNYCIRLRPHQNLSEILSEQSEEDSSHASAMHVCL